MLKTILKWTAIVGGIAVVIGLLAFLYFIPPFFSVPPEQYVKDTAAMALSLDSIADPRERAMAERGRYIVMTTGCGDCHTTPGPQGPRADMYLAGGLKMVVKTGGGVVSRNLTSDPETGIGNRKDEEILRVLRGGVFHDGRTMNYRNMPWSAFANWTEEDRRAVLAYLRAVKPVKHRIPDPMPDAMLQNGGGAAEEFYNLNYGNVPGASK
jgi:hypothetical protein